MRGRILLAVAAGLLATGLLALAAAWLATARPEIDSSSGTHICDAPFDVVLNDADSRPAGDPPNADALRARCEDTASNRFWVASASGLAALTALVVTVVAVIRRED